MLFLRVIVFVIFVKGASFGGISEQKCQEYSKAVYVQQQSPVLMMNPQSNTVSECGIVSVPLIVGGENAQVKEFPHMAVIGFGQSPMEPLAWNCGGSLISEMFVLTAAHCLYDRNNGPAQKVRLGMIDLNAPGQDLQEKIVAERIAHPQFRAPLKYNDIALLRLDGPVQFTPYVRPACLNDNDYIPQPKAIATGFGKLSYDSGGGSQYLMKVSLSFIPRQTCLQSFAHEQLTMPQGVADSMICAGELQGGKDTCQGDSGGPLQIVLRQPYCMYSLVGVTSFGKFCGYASSPAIYTKVSSFVPWIESIVWN